MPICRLIICVVVSFAFWSCSSVRVSGPQTSSLNQGLRRTGGPESRAQPATPPSASAIKNDQAEVGNAQNFRSVLDQPEIGKYYQNARRVYDSGNKREGLNLIQSYYKNYPQGQFADEAAYTASAISPPRRT